MAFGERLQEVRRRAGLTQEQFAAELNVSRQAVSKWESCRGYPEIEKILYICNRYQVSLDELFSQEVPRPGPGAARAGYAAAAGENPENGAVRVFRQSVPPGKVAGSWCSGPGRWPWPWRWGFV